MSIVELHGERIAVADATHHRLLHDPSIRELLRVDDTLTVVGVTVEDRDFHDHSRATIEVRHEPSGETRLFRLWAEPQAKEQE